MPPASIHAYLGRLGRQHHRRRRLVWPLGRLYRQSQARPARRDLRRRHPFDRGCFLDLACRGRAEHWALLHLCHARRRADDEHLSRRELLISRRSTSTRPWSNRRRSSISRAICGTARRPRRRSRRPARSLAPPTAEWRSRFRIPSASTGFVASSSSSCARGRSIRSSPIPTRSCRYTRRRISTRRLTICARKACSKLSRARKRAASLSMAIRPGRFRLPDRQAGGHDGRGRHVRGRRPRWPRPGAGHGHLRAARRDGRSRDHSAYRGAAQRIARWAGERERRRILDRCFDRGDRKQNGLEGN